MENNEYYNKGYYESAEPIRSQKPEYTKKQKWLLAFTLVLGAVFAWDTIDALFRANTIAEFAVNYAIFWGIYLVSFYFAVWDRRQKRAEALYVLAAAALLFLRFVVYKENTLSFFNLLMIPVLLMLHAVFTTADIPRGKEANALKLWFFGWIIKPFICLGNWFGAIGGVFKGAKGDKRVLIGLLCAIPIAAIVIALLVSADSVMQYYFEYAFSDIKLGEIILRAILALTVAALFFSFIFSMSYNKDTVKAQETEKRLDPVSAMVVVGMLCVVYAIFTYLQFVYLTGIKGLPAELTYSEYAVRGFNELLIVAAINFVVFFTVLTFAREHRALKPMLAVLLAETGVIIYSGIARLSMYIDAYALTVLRIIPMWFMIFLAFLLVLSFVKLFVKKVPFFRIALAVFVAWYIALNAVNIDAMVAQSIISRAHERGKMNEHDAWFLAVAVSEDASEVIERSEFRDQILDIRKDHDDGEDHEF